MARARLARKSSSIAIQMEIKYPSWMKKLLREKLPSDEARKSIIAPAIRQSMTPISKQLRVEARNIAKSSPRKQGSGATSRAVIIKVGRHKTAKDVVYGIVGINRRWYEVMHNRQGSRRGKFMTYAGEMNFRRDVRTRRRQKAALRRIKAGVKEVTSYYKTSFSSNKRKGSPVIKRIPVRYFHLIELGFNHRSGVRGRAHRIMMRSVRANATQVQKNFEFLVKKKTVAYLRRKGIPI